MMRNVLSHLLVINNAFANFVRVHRYSVYKLDGEDFHRVNNEENNESSWENIGLDKVLWPNERMVSDFDGNNSIQKWLPDKEYCIVADYRKDPFPVF